MSTGFVRVLAILLLAMMRHLAAKPQLIVVSLPTGNHAQYYKAQLDGTLKPMVELFGKYSYRVAEGGDIFMIVHERGDKTLDDGDFHEDTMFLEVTRPLDFWMRDFTHTVPDITAKFKYRPDYLTANEAAYSENDYFAMLNNNGAKWASYYDSYVKLDGGNIVENGVDKAITTMRAVSDNSNLAIETFRSRVAKTINRSKVCILPDYGDMTGHSDGLVSFLNASTLLVGDYGDYDVLVRKLKTCFGDSVKYVRLVSFEPKWNRQTRVATTTTAIGAYVNMLVTDNAIYVPQFGDAADQEALNTVKTHAGGKKVLGVNTAAIGHMGGNVRCISWQLYADTDIALAITDYALKKKSLNKAKESDNTVSLLNQLLDALKQN